MKRTTKYVALDVHQASTVASVREVSGPVLARSVPGRGGLGFHLTPAATALNAPRTQ